MANTSKATPQKKGKFVASLQRCGNVSESVRLVGVNRKTVYTWREEDGAFAEAWDDALAAYIESMEAEADRRGVHGVVKPVFYKGETVATVQEYSDTLLMFRLKGERPDKYREVPTPHGISPQVLHLFVQKVLVYVNDTQAQDLLDFLGTQLTLAGTRGGPAPVLTASGTHES